MPLRLWILEDEEDKNNVTRERDEMTTSVANVTEEERFKFEERAAIMEFDGGLSRTEAEEKARKQRMPMEDCA